MGSRSKSDTRIFRISHRDPRMIERAVQARSIWDEWSATAGINLVGYEGLLANTSDRADRAATMQALGVFAELVSNTELLDPLTSSHIDEELLYDPWAGVINAAGTGQFLKGFCERNIVKQAVKSIEITELGDAIVHSAQESWRCDSVIVLAGNATRALAATCGVEAPIELERVSRFTFRMTDESAVLPCWFDEFDKWNTWGLTVKPGYWAIGIHWDGEPTQMSVSQEDSAAGVLSALRENMPQRMERLEQNPVDLIACVADAGGDSMNAKRQGPVLAFWGDNQFKFAPVLGAAIAESAINQSLPNLPLTTSNS